MRAALGRILDFTVESRWREIRLKSCNFVKQQACLRRGGSRPRLAFEFGLEGEGSEPKLPRMEAAEIQPEH